MASSVALYCRLILPTLLKFLRRGSLGNTTGFDRQGSTLVKCLEDPFGPPSLGQGHEGTPLGVSLVSPLTQLQLLQIDPPFFIQVSWITTPKNSSLSQCPVCKGTGSQLVMVCVGKYPGGQSQQWVLWSPTKAVGYARSYWSGVLCTPDLAVLRVRVYGF